jgi:hypothetical protein
MPAMDPDNLAASLVIEEIFGHDRTITLSVSPGATREQLAEEYKKLSAEDLARHLRAVADALKFRATKDGIRLRGPYIEILNVLDGTTIPANMPVGYPTKGQALTAAEAEDLAKKDNLAIQLMIEANQKRLEEEQAVREARRKAEEQRQLTLKELSDGLKAEVLRLETALEEANRRLEHTSKSRAQEKTMSRLLFSLFKRGNR